MTSREGNILIALASNSLKAWNACNFSLNSIRDLQADNFHKGKLREPFQ